MAAKMRMRRGGLDKLVPLAGKKKRLRSLDEFEPPYWLGLFRLRAADEARLWPVILLGLGIGAAIGWFLLRVS